MKKIQLGHSDLHVSHICLGSMTFGEQNTEADGHAQMDYALAQGINFFDTSEMYAVPPKPETQGSTERIIGTWFKARGNRGKVILATKAAGRAPMNWLRDNAEQCASVLDVDLRTAPSFVFDLSVGSLLLGADPAAFETEALTATIFGALKKAGAAVGIGRYDEARALYTTPEFAGSGQPTDEHRTVHLGIDLFVESGAPVLRAARWQSALRCQQHRAA